VNDIPKSIEGIDRVEILVIDDGSSDKTVEVARELGVHHIIRNRRNIGLAQTFARGIDHALKLGADIIVNTDGDNQYAGQDISQLVAPILEKTADLVVGDRQTAALKQFSPLKRALQKIGSTVVRNLSNVDVPDAVSGFRAFSREAAIRLNILSNFSYTTEMLIQAGRKSFAVESVPVGTNSKTRESRLFKSIPQFITQQAITTLRMYVMYQPLRFFVYFATALGIMGAIPVARFVILYFIDGGAGHIQSLLLGGVLLMMSFLAFLSGVVADLISFNRQLNELTLEKIRRLSINPNEPSEPNI
jgi:glycosyltransferase involved in cell wall biosynthesis